MENQVLPQGAKFLKITGILMIVFGAIGLIAGLLVFASATATVALLTQTGYAGLTQEQTDSLVGMLGSTGLVGVVGGLIQLLAGIIGVAFSKKTEKSMICLILGVITALFAVFSSIVFPMIINADPTIASTGIFTINYFGLTTGLIIPVLYIVGAIKNKKSV